MENINGKIDLILPWVDDTDMEWRREKEKYKEICGVESKSDSNIRFQSWDNLHLLFRAIEKFMPWINRVFLVTCGQVPQFLKVDYPKIRIVKHTEYIPAKYLPTFNSNTIEMNYHRIQDLSENFIIFNDDLFPLQPIEEEYYFKNNTVCDEAVEGHIVPVDTGLISNMARYVQVNNMMIINRYFHKTEVQKKNWEKWYCEDYGDLIERNRSLSYWYDFAGFRDPHMANAIKKTTLSHLWKIEPEVLDSASKNHFRSHTDVSQYLIRYWQLCKGDFYPRRTLGKFYAVDINNYKQVAKEISEQKWQMVSINENCTVDEFKIIKEEINRALSIVLPQKSSFEK